ncbi:MAG: AAA family ATPase [Longimicrobiales bacterium]
MPSPPSIVLRFFDDPGVFGPDSKPLLSLGKPFAALTYLWFHPKGVGREALARLLWSTAPSEAHALASVRQAVWTLRDRLGPDVVESSGPALRLEQSVLDRCDIDAFLGALEAERATRAIEVWGRGFLTGLALSGQPAWDRWVDEERDRLNQRLCLAADREARLRVQEGALWQAVALRRFLVQQRPWSADALTDLLELLADADAHEELEGEILATRTALAADGRATDERDELLAVLRRFEDRKVPKGRSEYVGGGVPRVHLPFVGRSKELAALRRWLSEGGADAPTALVTGPAGIGKSRLVDEVVRGLDPDAKTLVRIQAHETDHRTPWSLLLLLIRALATKRGAAGISARSAATLVGLAPSLEPVLGSTGHDRTPTSGEASIGDAAFDLLDAVADERPVLLVLDDLQWGDPESLRAIVRLGRRARTHRTRILAVCRSGEIDETTLAGLRRGTGDRSVEVSLVPLTEPAVHEAVGLLVRCREPDLVAALHRRVYQISGGNPLILSSVLDDLRARGLLQATTGGVWEFQAETLEAVGVPESLHDLIASQVATLTEAARTALGRLAHATGPLTAEDLARTSSLDARAPLRELERRGLVRWEPDGSVALTHELTRGVVRRVLPVAVKSRASRWIRMCAAAAILVAVGWGWGTAASPSGTTDQLPFDLFAWSGSDYVLLRPDPERGTATLIDSMRPAQGFRGHRARRGIGGDIHLFGSVVRDDRPPDAAVARWGEAPEVLFATAADDNVIDASPDRRWTLVTTADSVAGLYSRRYVVLDSVGTARTIGHGLPGEAMGLSPSGGRVLSVEAGRPDTLVVRSLRGDTWRLPARGMVGEASWCSDTEVVFADGQSGRLPELFVWRLGDNEAARLDAVPVEEAGHWLFCSGPWVGRLAARGGPEELVLFHRATGESVAINLGLPGPLTFIRPVGRAPPHVPVAIRAAGLPKRLEWGTAHTIHATVLDPSGRVMPEEPVTWSSSDASVLGVRGDRLTANRPGSGVVTGWVRDVPLFSDTLTVYRRAGAPIGALLAEDFSAPLTDGWWVHGTPAARTGVHDGRSVLVLPGDGSFPDGIRSRSTFDLSSGARLEFEFFLPLTASFHQRISFCLESSDPAVPEPTRALDWVTGPWGCVAYPARELRRFSPGEISLRANGAPFAPLSIPPQLVPAGWTHVELEMRPDGFATLRLGREVVAELPLGLPLTEHRWRVRIEGASVGTTLLVRDLVLWGGTGGDTH